MIATTSLPDASQDVPYTAQLSATGGTPAYSWTITSGSLPAGLTLSSSGAITGTPTATGTASFTAQVSDSKSVTASVPLSLAVAFPGQQSANWAGYISPSSSTVTGVGATWTVPTLDCSATPNAGASSWIGIGGAGTGTGDLLQTGVTSDCDNGVQQNSGWWEEYPEVVETPFSSFPVSAGDVINVQVGETVTDQWQTELDDTTTGLFGGMQTEDAWGVGPDTGTTFTAQGSTAGLSYAGGTTAEWIVEDYLNGSTGELVPFADFGTVTFSNMGIAPGPATVNSANESEIVQNGQLLAQPTEPSGSSMTVSYTG